MIYGRIGIVYGTPQPSDARPQQENTSIGIINHSPTLLLLPLLPMLVKATVRRAVRMILCYKAGSEFRPSDSLFGGDNVTLMSSDPGAAHLLFELYKGPQTSWHDPRAESSAL
ncbi:hypothetical protein CIHG_09361 [Coccidioides immitis H538.4]|uniref:Uncharacterized protein n=1 Tax=Coccidioides immitis H538.4 TaxID=396776 RepID=A0A0J8S3Z7_COCIT|nr:hypothetical protein CIHG_09361 [Coccidioides immitis H538.4]